jgi:predicted AlkP superfamily phosphohydrolase/phosphomutase
MPNLARIFSHSPHGVMLSEAPLISPAIWTTFATGQHRDVHGIDNFLTKLPQEYKEVDMTSRFRRVPAVWNIASWAGRTVGIVNWNAAYPAEEVNGIFVGHGISLDKITEKTIFPAEWMDRVRGLTPATFDKMEARLQQMPGTQAQNAYDHDRLVYTISQEILRETHPDLMMVYFPGVDVVSHIYWKYRWPLSMGNCFRISAQKKKFRDVIENHYEFTDAMIGGLVKQAEGYTVFIISDHGLGPNFPPNNYYLHLNHLLERMGYFHYADKSCETILSDLAQEGFLPVPDPVSANIFMLARALVAEAGRRQNSGRPLMGPEEIRQWLQGQVRLRAEKGGGKKINPEQMKALAKSLTPGSVGIKIKWSKTTAWNIEDMRKGLQGIFINANDRYPQGSVQPGTYDSLQQQITSSLAALRTEKNRPLFLSVRPNRARPAKEPWQPDIPDILVEVNRQALADNLIYKGRDDRDPIPMAAIRWIYYQGSGDHIPEGVFLLTGTNAKGFGKLDVSLYDIMPTILWALGIPAGADMRGRVFRQGFTEPVSGHDPIRISSWTGKVKQKLITGVSSPDENRLQQLRALGYIQQ